jgi:hypothetical protein
MKLLQHAPVLRLLGGGLGPLRMPLRARLHIFVCPKTLTMKGLVSAYVKTSFASPHCNQSSKFSWECCTLDFTDHMYTNGILNSLGLFA